MSLRRLHIQPNNEIDNGLGYQPKSQFLSYLYKGFKRFASSFSLVSHLSSSLALNRLTANTFRSRSLSLYHEGDSNRVNYYCGWLPKQIVSLNQMSASSKSILYKRQNYKAWKLYSITDIRHPPWLMRSSSQSGVWVLYHRMETRKILSCLYKRYIPYPVNFMSPIYRNQCRSGTIILSML